MVKVRKNIESTHSNQPARLEALQEVADLAPMEQIFGPIEKEMFCFVVWRDDAENTIYSNLIGRFLKELVIGMNYMFVCYVYKLNKTLLHTMTNREDTEMISFF